jgi:serine/threonine protein kinase
LQDFRLWYFKTDRCVESPSPCVAAHAAAADAYDSYAQATNMKGSVFWMAPEVIHSANERTYSGKIDIWSLGCVVVEMWTGKRPWGDLEQVAAMYEVSEIGSRSRLREWSAR